MPEDIYGDDEERMNPEIKLDVDIPVQPRNVIGALNVNEELVGRIREVDDMTKVSVDLVKWANSQGQLTEEQSLEAARVKAFELTSAYGRVNIATLLEAEKNDPAKVVTAKRLEHALVLNWSNEINYERVFEKLLAGEMDLEKFLESTEIQTWIHKNPQPRAAISRLFFDLTKKYTLLELAKQLSILERLNGKDAVKKTAQMLSVLQMTIWKKAEFSADKTYELFLLNKADVDSFDNPLLDSPMWNVWILYLIRLNDLKKQSYPELAALVIPVLRKHYIDQTLFDWFLHANTEKLQAQHFKKALIDVQEKEREMRKRKGNDDEALAPTKRQRKDDGQ
ncbi:hypothetical protein DD238_005313 [Peronospora effusa]|uniref:Uncharacterized protein n=1 Tax=Peronospora effusa TaxID=542832 RepID=A0A3M6VQE7_9STRA|nr:hypothetical protein DD238_005313 [Peronospora effusa]